LNSCPPTGGYESDQIILVARTRVELVSANWRI